MVFEPGETGKSILIPLLDDGSLENTEQFTINLSNPQGGAELGAVITATFHLIDDESSNAPAGSGDVSFNVGTGSNGTVNALSLLPDGRVLVGGDFDVFNGIPVSRLVRLLVKWHTGPNLQDREGAECSGAGYCSIVEWIHPCGGEFQRI